jgi:hypothetical protein
VVGLLLLLVALGTVFVRLVTGLRGPNRTMYGALFAAMLTLAIHAGVDWDWEMPVVFVWLFALAGLALAAPTRRRGSSGSLSLAVRAGLGVIVVLLALIPAQIAASQSQLDDSLDAYQESDCKTAIDLAQSASDTLGSRPEPYEVVGYCRILEGRGRLAVGQMQKAVKQDPDNWEYRYDLALALGASGRDPRAAAQAALRLDPLGELTRLAVRRFDNESPHRWRRAARKLARDTDL